MTELESLKKGNLYDAGHPGFPRNFSRDSIISAILMEDNEMLKNQLLRCAEKQGKASNPDTGEEKGKIFHEDPSVKINEKWTDFAACDTTAMFLIGLENYLNFSADKTLAESLKSNIEAAVEYIYRHTPKNLFLEDPRYCGADNFALKVTYWKDSALIQRVGGEPKYPVTYALAHVQNLRALRCAQEILQTDYQQKITQMLDGLHSLFDPSLGLFAAFADEDGKEYIICSDMLHALSYLKPGDLTPVELQSIEKMAETLETSHGYRTIEAKYCNLNEAYHSCTLWPFEQAMIHNGANHFDLLKIAEVSARIYKYLDTAPELFFIGEDSFTKSGCDPQLWTIATKTYFQKRLI